MEYQPHKEAMDVDAGSSSSNDEKLTYSELLEYVEIETNNENDNYDNFKLLVSESHHNSLC